MTLSDRHQIGGFVGREWTELAVLTLVPRDDTRTILGRELHEHRSRPRAVPLLLRSVLERAAAFVDVGSVEVVTEHVLARLDRFRVHGLPEGLLAVVEIGRTEDRRHVVVPKLVLGIRFQEVDPGEPGHRCDQAGGLELLRLDCHVRYLLLVCTVLLIAGRDAGQLGLELIHPELRRQDTLLASALPDRYHLVPLLALDEAGDTGDAVNQHFLTIFHFTVLH